MASIAELLVKLGLDAGTYNSEIQKAAKATQDFEQTVKQSLESLKELFEFEAVAEGVQKLVEFAEKGAEAAEEMERLSIAAGEPVEEIQKLAFAANQSGLGAEQLGTALNHLAKEMSAAASGGKEQSELFSALGVSVTDANGKLKGTDEVFGDIADRLAGMKDGAQKTAIELQIFGKAGAELGALLDQGSAGIRKMGQEADALGLIIDEKTNAAAKEFGEELKKLVDAATAFETRAAAALEPTMQELVKLFEDGAQESSNFEGAITVISGTFKLIAVAAEATTEAFKLLGSGLGAVAAEATLLAHGEFKAAFDTFKDSIQNVGEGLGETAGKISQTFTASWNDSRAAAKNYEDSLNDIQSSLNRLKQSAADAQIDTDDMNASIRDARKVYEETRTPAEKYREALADLSRQLKEGYLDQDTYSRGVDQAEQQLQRATKTVKDSTKTAFDAIVKEYQNFQGQIQTFGGSDLIKVKFDIDSGPLSVEFAKAGAAASAYKDKILQARQELTALQEAQSNAQIEQDDINQSVSDARRIYEETRTPLEKYTASVQDFGRQLEEGYLDQDTFSRAVQQAKTQYEEATKKAEDSGNQMSEFAKQASRNIQDAFGKLFESGFTNGLKGWETQFEKTLANLASQALAANLLGDLFGTTDKKGGATSGLLGDGGLDSIFKGLFSGGGTGSTGGSSLGSLFSKGASWFGGLFADGGSPPTGKASIVGENGPELFVPNAGGTVVSNKQLQQSGAMGGGSVEHHHYLHFADGNQTLNGWWQNQLANMAANT